MEIPGNTTVTLVEVKRFTGGEYGEERVVRRVGNTKTCTTN